MKWLLTILLLLVSFKTTEKSLVLEIQRTKEAKEIRFIKQRTKTGCFKACKEIVKEYGRITNYPDVVQIGKEHGNKLVITPKYKYLDSLLDMKIPVVVGVHHTFDYGFNEGTTDHYLVVTAKGIDSLGAYYQFFDVGKLNGSSEKLKLRFSKGRLVYKKYVLTQIRKYG